MKKTTEIKSQLWRRLVKKSGNYNSLLKELNKIGREIIRSMENEKAELDDEIRILEKKV